MSDTSIYHEKEKGVARLLSTSSTKYVGRKKMGKESVVFMVIDGDAIYD